MINRSLAFFGAVATLVGMPSLALAQTPFSTVYAFTNLQPRSPVTGSLPGSAGGDTAGGVTVGNVFGDYNGAGSNAFRWNADGTVTNLHAAAVAVVGATDTTYLNGVDAGGVITGDAYVANRPVALRWNTNGSVTNLQSLVSGTVRQSQAIRVQNGVAAGYAELLISGTTYRSSAVRWNADNSVKNLNDLASTQSLLGAVRSTSAIALDGNVTVGQGRSSTGTGNRFHALRWNADDSVTNLHTLTGTQAILGTGGNSSAYGVRDGVTVGSGSGTSTGSNTYALRWNADGTVTNLHAALPAKYSASEAWASASAAGGTLTVGNATSQPDITQARFAKDATVWLPGGGTVNLATFVPNRDPFSDVSAFSLDPVTGVITGSASLDAAIWTPLVSGGTNALTVRPGDATTISQNFSQSAGATVVNGSLDMSGNTFTLAGGTLGGAGSITGNVSVAGGTLAPGNSPGTLSLVGNFAMSGGIYAIELSSASVFDVLNVSGAASFAGGTFSVSTLGGFTPIVGQFFDIVTTTGGVGGVNSVTLPQGYTFTQVGNAGRLTFVGATVVPEANAGLLALLALPVAGFVAAHRRK